MDKKVLFSGIKPSGELTLGNYLGAIKYWVQLQEQYDCYFSIVNLHAITVKQDPQELRTRTLDLLATYISSGIDVDNCTLFIQSQVKEHAELAWLLNCNSYMGELNRMTQFKDKSAKAESTNAPIGVGLFTYPILMAADILLYGTEVVPVGIDQKQHTELTRDIAIRFNNHYGDTFKIPEPFIQKTGAKIMDLTDPTKKMSKSDQDPSQSVNGYILLSDSKETIMKKIKRAVTDDIGKVQYSDDQPGIKNLLNIYCSIKNISAEEAAVFFADYRYGDFKVAVANAVIEELEPIQQRKAELLAQPDYLRTIYEQGAIKARSVASKYLQDVKDKMGIL